MEQITSLIGWFTSHAGQLAAIVTSVIGTATLIVKMTPTQSDDNVLARIVAFISKWIALNDTKQVDALKKTQE